MPSFRPFDPNAQQKLAADGAAQNIAAAASQPTGKLSDRAMLIDLTISRWQATKHDKRVTREVAQTHGNAEHMGKYTKQLMPAEALAPIQTLTTAVATYHRQRTLPWLDTGSRILSSAAYFDYTAQMRVYQAQWNDAVDTFVAAYPAMINQAKQLLNGLFDPSEYPSVNSIRDKFNLSYAVYPFPDSTDFRVQLGAAETALVRQQIEQTTQAAIQQAMSDITKRIAETVGRMAQRLQGYKVTADGVEGRFHDTLVSNVEDLIALIPILNITNDPNINKLAIDMTELIRYTPQQLRDDTTARTDTAAKAEAILKAMEDFV